MLSIEYNLKPISERRTVPFIPAEQLPFGKLRSDHMLTMEYSEGKWHSPKIVPYYPLSVMPGAIAINYGQEIFEGAKAFQHENQELYLFRFDQHVRRFNNSADIVCMPRIPEEELQQAVEALVDVDRLWFPQQSGASLYIRPVMIGTDDTLGVKESTSYLLCVFLSPSGAYYQTGFNPISLLVTDKFHRVAPGGTGQAKTGGNYAASLRAKRYAAQHGAQQVLFLDVTNTYIEEAGAMNHYHVEAESIIIPEFTDTILESITSRSFLELSNRLGGEVKQTGIPLDEFIEKIQSQRIIEAGGLGTAAVVSPVGEYVLDLERYRKKGLERVLVGEGKVGSMSRKMFETLTAIQTGTEPAPEGWMQKVRHVR